MENSVDQMSNIFFSKHSDQFIFFRILCGSVITLIIHMISNHDIIHNIFSRDISVVINSHFPILIDFYFLVFFYLVLNK